MIKKKGPLPRSSPKKGIMYGMAKLSLAGVNRAERQIREQHRRRKK